MTHFQPKPINHVVVVGGGNAGFLSALSLRILVPGLNVTVVHSSKIPVIGVGESTTAAIPRFIHGTLGLDQGIFYDQVHPTWKLGLRFIWGDPRDSHFNYTFEPFMGTQPEGFSKPFSYHCLSGINDACMSSALMNTGKAPCNVTRDGSIVPHEHLAYHIDNHRFIAYLADRAQRTGVQVIDATVQGVRQDDSGFIESLILEDGQTLSGDLFVDCSGFASRLLGKVMNEPFVSYGDSLFCDHAVIGSWRRTDEPINPYTTVETMNHGWCWRIELEDRITRGYVHSSAFCSLDEARDELLAKNPQIEGDTQVIGFQCGRYANAWNKNVVAIGNSAGFIEPLEATALHLICDQIWFLANTLIDSERRLMDKAIDLENKRFRIMFDGVRDFLDVHYKFNRRLDTPFWQQCRNDISLHGAKDFVDYYREAGPSLLGGVTLDAQDVFGVHGYLTMLLGQRVPTKYAFNPSTEEQWRWNLHRQTNADRADSGISVKQALAIIHHPKFEWPIRGIDRPRANPYYPAT